MKVILPIVYTATPIISSCDSATFKLCLTL
jgi:hypothetical protein